MLTQPATAQGTWEWSTIRSGQGTDSIGWAWTWGSDTLNWGENYVCCLPLESDAGTTGNLGPGTPFAGNMIVRPIYRVQAYTGCAGPPAAPDAFDLVVKPSLIRELAFVSYRLPNAGPVSLKLCDAAGRVVQTLVATRQNIGQHTLSLRASGSPPHLAPGVYFLRLLTSGRVATRKIVLAE